MIVIINPNSTVAMTDAMLKVARETLPNAEIEAWTSHDGPASIQGPEDGDASVPPLLELAIKACIMGADTIIIGCFDDTGLAEVRAAVSCRVIGLGQAAYHVASLLGDRFSVVTTLPVSVPVLQENIIASGFRGKLAKVRASGVTVLSLEETPQTAAPIVLDEIYRAADEDNSDSIILGCAGMIDIPDQVDRAKTPLVVEPVRTAVLLAYVSSELFR